mgnify:CR=1 FL=1
MTKLFLKPRLSVIMVIALAALVVSCSKDNDNKSSAVELLSFGPTGAKHGDTLKFIGNNLDKVTAIEFTGNNAVVNQQDFKHQSSNLILLLVPSAAERGQVKLKTSQGEIVSKTQLDLEVVPSVSQLTSQARIGSNISISGSYLNWVSGVTFGNNKTVETFVTKSFDQLVVTVPEDAETGPLVLSYTGTKSDFFETTDTLYITLPAVTSLSPNPVDPEGELTIEGTDLDLVEAVILENVDPVTDFVSQTPSKIVLIVPDGTARGAIKLDVINSSAIIQSEEVLEITGTAPPPALALTFYDDAVTSNWNGWIGGGWGGTSNRDNTSPVREGTKSVKIDYSGGWGSPFQLGGANIDVSPYTQFKISVFGAPGSAGKKINIGINASDKYTIDVVEGEWTDYAIPLSSLTTGPLTEIWVKEFSGTGGFTVYIDALGLF